MGARAESTLTESLEPPSDWRTTAITVGKLALPFTLNSGVQAVLTATDTWFVGHVSPAATAALSAAGWPVLVFIFLLGGAGLAVQTLVAQAYGSRCYTRASRTTWTAAWAALLTVPLFIALAALGESLFSHLRFEAETHDLMVEYWLPRMWGAPLAVLLTSLLGFFNGVERVGTTLRISSLVAIVNVILNQIFVVNMHWGVAGSAWATNIAELVGVAAAFVAFLAPGTRAIYKSDRTVRPRLRPLYRQVMLGVPFSLQYVGEILGFALFQFIVVRLGPVQGAATQIVVALTSVCYLPASGLALAGTTLVGKWVGAQRPDIAYQAGNTVILMAVVYMSIVGLALAIAGASIVTPFTNPADPRSAAVVVLAQQLLWIAAAYQFFDGLSIATGGCLRGAADVRVPAAIVLLTSWALFVPLTHSLAFANGEGWVHWMPQFGLAAIGAWIAALAYMASLGVLLYARWRWAARRRFAMSTSRAQRP